MSAISSIRAKVLLIALVTVLTGSAFGYWGVTGYEQRERRDDIAWLVQDTSLRLRVALVTEPPAATPNHEDMLRSYYDHAIAVDAHLRKLRELDAAGAGIFVDAADDYLMTAREILLRRASGQRHHVKFARDLQRLHDHMRSDDRTGGWITAAVRAKEQVEEDYRDFRITHAALVTLLDAFPATQARIAPHIDAVHLIEDGVVATVRERIASLSKATAHELDRYANLNRYR